MIRRSAGGFAGITRLLISGSAIGRKAGLSLLLIALDRAQRT
jgi:hypothetical protein